MTTLTVEKQHPVATKRPQNWFLGRIKRPSTVLVLLLTLSVSYIHRVWFDALAFTSQSASKVVKTRFLLDQLWECNSQGCENTKTLLNTPPAPASTPAHRWHVWFRGSVEQTPPSEHREHTAVMKEGAMLILWSHWHIPQVLITQCTLDIWIPAVRFNEIIGTQLRGRSRESVLVDKMAFLKVMHITRNMTSGWPSVGPHGGERHPRQN